jgi:hypothetical protein
MRWITRAHVHVDRVACPWLISRFVDSEAEFLFVAPGLVRQVAEEQGATPFDVPGVELGHANGSCSFMAIVRKYGLKDPGLLLLAEVVNAADTGRLDANPLARGLDAIAQGFSLIHTDDHENIARQFEVYDALYAFCRLSAAAAAPVAPA